ncbi:hypothetical protein D3C71_1206960 [compost metagenome]
MWLRVSWCKTPPSFGSRYQSCKSWGMHLPGATTASTKGAPKVVCFSAFLMYLSMAVSITLRNGTRQPLRARGDSRTAAIHASGESGSFDKRLRNAGRPARAALTPTLLPTLLSRKDSGRSVSAGVAFATSERMPKRITRCRLCGTPWSSASIT